MRRKTLSYDLADSGMSTSLEQSRQNVRQCALIMEGDLVQGHSELIIAFVKFAERQSDGMSPDSIITSIGASLSEISETRRASFEQEAIMYILVV